VAVRVNDIRTAAAAAAAAATATVVVIIIIILVVVFIDDSEASPSCRDVSRRHQKRICSTARPVVIVRRGDAAADIEGQTIKANPQKENGKREW
jgi:hypothetical protein